ncbi:MAG: hypothetical protein AAF937_05825 [Planctomycetota bacterium]
MTSKPLTHAVVIAFGGGLAAAVGGGVSMAMGGPASWAAVLTVIATVPACLPALLPERAVASKYGSLVLLAMTAQVIATLCGSLLVRVVADFEPKPFLGGVAAGAGVLLSVQVAVSVWTLSRARPAVLADGIENRVDTDA